MRAATYLKHLTPHSALGMTAPATRWIFRVSGPSAPGAFVHIETHTKPVDEKAWEGRLYGYNQDNKVYRIDNTATHKVVESRNDSFLEIPPQMITPPGIGRTGPWKRHDQDGRPLTAGGGVHDLTQRLDLDVLQDDHPSPIIQFTSPELAKILSRPYRFINGENPTGRTIAARWTTTTKRTSDTERTTSIERTTAAIASRQHRPAPGDRRRRRGAHCRN